MSEATQSRPPGVTLRGNLRRRLRHPSVFVAAAFTITGLTSISAPASAALADPAPPAAPSLCPGANLAQFGPNVCVFNPSMPLASIQADLDNISENQVLPDQGQFDGNRYAIFFEPGTYGSTADPLIFEVGYYTEVAGLGAMPQETVINGEALVPNTLCQGTGPFTGTAATCNSDDNFWRSLSNLTLNVMNAPSPPVIGAESPNIPEPGFTPTFNSATCYESAEMWSASQADPLRRDIINGSIFFQDFCSPQNFASGGFIADSQFENGTMQFDGNQQFITRNSSLSAENGCPGGLWNNVFSGDTGAGVPAPVFTGQCQQNTVIAATPVSEEEPFLYAGADGSLAAFLPAVQHATSGPSWAAGSPSAATPAEPGSSLPLRSFFIANPNTPVFAINLALALGKNLVLTPGVYDLGAPIVVSRPDTVVLSLGYATLVPTRGNAAMVVLPNNGVKLAGGIIFDAGAVNSPFLLSAGSPIAPANPSDPDLFSDVFFRVGGAESPAHATVSFVDAAPNSIIDDMWAWRADHGTTSTSTGWTVNTGSTGLVVSADNVSAYGLAVEHYQKNEVIWSGQGGTVEFFQNELPYDVPSQADWMATPKQDGYPAFLVSPNVSTFTSYGMGSYVTFLQTTATLFDQDPFEAPTRPGVQFNNTVTVYIGGNGGDNSVIDGTGGANVSPPATPGTVVDLPSFS
jgi:hypothetical protein